MDMLTEEENMNNTKDARTPQQGPPAPAWQQQGYNQNYQPSYPQPYPPPRRQSSMADDIIRNPMYIGLGIALSVFIMWLGLVFQAIMIGSTDGKTMMQISLILYNLGIAGLIIVLLFVGLGRRDYPQWVRAMLILGAILLIVWGFANILTLGAAMGNIMHAGGYIITPGAMA